MIIPLLAPKHVTLVLATIAFNTGGSVIFSEPLIVKGQVSKQDLEDRNVLFMDDSAPVYLGKMTAVML